MNEIVLDNPQQIYKIINQLNRSRIFESINISSLTPNQNYLKWFSPSLDYPCVSNAYYLFPPFTVMVSPAPTINVSGEIGENKNIIDVVKQYLLETILHAID